MGRRGDDRGRSGGHWPLGEEKCLMERRSSEEHMGRRGDDRGRSGGAGRWERRSARWNEGATMNTWGGEGTAGEEAGPLAARRGEAPDGTKEQQGTHGGGEGTPGEEAGVLAAGREASDGGRS
jgi:hypothetical protein